MTTHGQTGCGRMIAHKRPGEPATFRNAAGVIRLPYAASNPPLLSVSLSIRVVPEAIIEFSSCVAR